MSIFNALGEGTSFSVPPGMGQRGVSIFSACGERTQPPFSVPLQWGFHVTVCLAIQRPPSGSHKEQGTLAIHRGRFELLSAAQQ